MQESETQCFLLTASWADTPAGHQLVFYGHSPERGPVKLSFTNQEPYFYIENGAELPPAEITFFQKKTSFKNFQEKPVDRLSFKTQRELWQYQELLNRAGLKSFEADIRSPERFLLEKKIYGSLEVKGEAHVESGLLCFQNPKVRPVKLQPQFTVASLDIETSVKDNSLFSIAIHLSGKEEQRKVFMRGEPTAPNEEYAEVRSFTDYLPTEEKLLTAFTDWFQQVDPDILIGWHVIGFDLKFLLNRAEQLKMPLRLGRGQTEFTLSEKPGVGFFANIPGRVVIDGPVALRSAFYQFENFKLETVAQELLGEGKDITSNEGKVEEIERRFYQDKEALAHYNFQDCALVTRIFDQTHMLALQSKRSAISGLLLDRIGISNAAFDHAMIPKLHAKGYVASNTADVVKAAPSEGGHVMRPTSGLHQQVVVLDFKSLYPSLIRTFKIDPYSRLKANVGTYLTPGGFYFSKTEHVLPAILEKLMQEREMAKESEDQPLSQAIKILMNSFYGVMGSYGCRFYHPDLAGSITTIGRWLLTSTQKYLEERRGYQVLYGDTDSLFIQLHAADAVDPWAKGKSLTKELNDYWRDRIKKEFGLESFLEMNFEKYYEKLLLPLARGSSEEGAKKRYSGLKKVNKNEVPTLDFVGLETVRSDWTKLAKDFQQELYRRIFYHEDIENWLRELVEQVRAGEHDQKLVYKKRLTKAPEEYTQNKPPQVKAALMLKKPTRRIEYLMTLQGPVPIQLNPSGIDYDHYVQKQLKPLVDVVLPFVEGVADSFDGIFEGTQLALF